MTAPILLISCAVAALVICTLWIRDLNRQNALLRMEVSHLREQADWLESVAVRAMQNAGHEPCEHCGSNTCFGLDYDDLDDGESFSMVCPELRFGEPKEVIWT